MAKIHGYWMWRKDYSIGPWLDDQDERKWSCHFTSNNQEFVGIETSIFDGIQEIGYSREGMLIPTEVRLSNLSTETNQSSVGWDNNYLIMNFGITEQEIDDELYSFISEHAYYLGTSSDLLVEIAENVQKVFDAGYKKANDDWYERGKQAERDAFWDAFQGATRRRWSSSFQYECWNDTTFYPKYNLIISGDASALFRYCGITDLEGRLNECGVTLDTSECTSLNTGFGESQFLTIVPPINVEKCTASNATNGLFAGCRSLKTVRKFIVSEETLFSKTFQNCPLLENIVFEGTISDSLDFGSCTLLTRASIESIINHLSDKASGETLTLSETAVDKAFAWTAPGPDEEKYEYGGLEEGSGNIWYPLVASKPNWQITLV